MDHLLYIGIVHCCFTAIFLATKRDRTLHDNVLAAWMVFMALPMLAGAAVRAFPDIYIPVLRSDLIYPLTYGPFLWLYVGSLIGDIDRLRASHYLHFLPFVLVSLVQLLTGWAPEPPSPEVTTFSLAVRVIGAVNLALLLVYSAAVFWRLRRHGREIVLHFSELSNRVTLTWLRWIAAGISGVYLLLFLASTLSWPALLDIHLVAQIGIILALSFFGLRQTALFERQDSAATDHDGSDLMQVASNMPAGSEAGSEDASSGSKRYSRSGLTDERAAIISQRLEAYMREHKPYLDAELTIERLAKRMAVPRRHTFDTARFADGVLYMPEFDVCAQLSTVDAGSSIDLAACDGSAAQSFTFAGEGAIVPVSAPEMCFTLAEDTRSGRSDTNQIKVLSLEACDDGKAAYQTWSVRTAE